MKRYLSLAKNHFKLSRNINWMLMSVALVFLAIMSDAGLLTRSFTGLLSRIAYSIILAVSLQLVVGFLGELSLGHAGFMCVGAYIGCFTANYLHTVIDSKLLVLVIAMLVGAAVAMVFGFIIGLPALRLKGDYLAIVTLAFGEIVRNIFKNLEIFGGAMGLKTKIYKPSELFIIAFIVAIFTIIFIQNLIRSKHGRAITAIRDNEIAAKAMGINVTYYKLLVFIIAAAFAGVAGVIYGHFTTPLLYTFFSYNYSIEILVMVVLGGMGSIHGSILAAIAITVINFLLQNNLSGDLAALRLLVYALILIVVIIFNNAPALKGVRARFNIRSFIRRFSQRKVIRPSLRYDDSAEWNQIETKIRMDEILTADLPHNEIYTPDPREKED